MATQGPFYWIDRALKKIGDGTLDLDTQALKMALVTSSQAIDRTFTGVSGDAHYSDITAELPTASGYTLGGSPITGGSLTRLTSSSVVFSSGSSSWTLTASVTFKYAVIYVDGSTNKDLLMVADMDTGGGSVTAIAGVLQFSPDPTHGWGYWEQP